MITHIPSSVFKVDLAYYWRTKYPFLFYSLLSVISRGLLTPSKSEVLSSLYSCMYCGLCYLYKNRHVGFFYFITSYRIPIKMECNLVMVNILQNQTLIILTNTRSLLLFLGERRYFCPNAHCGKRYKHETSFMFHIFEECGISQKYYCSLCLKSFNQYFSYKKHMLVVHKQILEEKMCAK